MQVDSKSVIIAVLTGNKEEQKGITEAVANIDGDYIFAPTMHALRDLLLEQPCSGILLCLTSLMGIDQSSKSFVQTLEQVYPVARIRWHEGKGTFVLIATRSGNVETLNNFAAICSNFVPRRLRRSERLAKTLNVLVSNSSDLANPAHAFTMNISVRGCFLHTPKEWAIGDSVYLQILELPRNLIIEGIVVRCVQWGVPFSAQGIGVQFINLENELIEELQRLLYYLPPARYPEGSPA
jgi:Tfp pilus assembly protein PilZ